MIGNTDNGLQILVVERTCRVSWAYMTTALDRIRAFCEKYDSDANVETLFDNIIVNFASGKPVVIPLLLLDRDGTVRGHMLLTIEDWMGCRMATIIQLEVDHETPLTIEVIQPAYDWVEGWAQKQGAQFLQCFARNEMVERLFRQRYGFDTKRILMRKKLAAAPVVAEPALQEA